MRVPVTLAAVAVVFTVASAQQQNQFVGKWEITGTGPDSHKIYFLNVVDKGGQLEARFLDRSAHATPVPWITVENGQLSWQKGNGSDTLPKPSCGPIYRAKLEGGKLVGSHEEPGSTGFSSADAGAPCPPANRGGGAGRAAGAPPAPAAATATAAPAAAPPAAPAPPKAPAAPPKAPTPPHTVSWVAVKQPTFKPANANGNHTYGAPKVIVGPGVGKETWSGNTPETWQSRCEDRWSIVDGAFKNEVAPNGQGNVATCNIYTKEKFQDFKAEMDFVLDAGQNSGFYLRGRHELQLSLGMNPNSSYPGQLLDIYGWKRADPPPVPNPPGELQSLTVVVVGNRLTATFNGKKVHDNTLLPGLTGNALDANELEPGPVLILGNDGKVWYRRITVTPIRSPLR